MKMLVLSVFCLAAAALAQPSYYMARSDFDSSLPLSVVAVSDIGYNVLPKEVITAEKIPFLGRLGFKDSVLVEEKVIPEIVPEKVILDESIVEPLEIMEEVKLEEELKPEIILEEIGVENVKPLEMKPEIILEEMTVEDVKPEIILEEMAVEDVKPEVILEETIVEDVKPVELKPEVILEEMVVEDVKPVDLKPEVILEGMIVEKPGDLKPPKKPLIVKWEFPKLPAFVSDFISSLPSINFPITLPPIFTKPSSKDITVKYLDRYSPRIIRPRVHLVE